MADVEVVGTPEVVKVIARGPAGTGASLAPDANWCQIGLSAGTLTNGAPFYNLDAADLTIVAQSGSDFSIGESGSPASGAILSAAGGCFDAAFYFSTPGGVTLDPSSTELRYLEFALILGDYPQVFPSLGIDTYVPVFANPDIKQHFALAFTPRAMPGRTSPGGPAARSVVVTLVNAVEGDEITQPFYNSGSLYVWQVA